jgi:hypothetical protein
LIKKDTPQDPRYSIEEPGTNHSYQDGKDLHACSTSLDSSQSNHPVVTPLFPYPLTYAISPLQKRLRIQSSKDHVTDAKLNGKQVRAGINSCATRKRTDSAVVICSRGLYNHDDDERMSLSRHFPVLLYRLLQYASSEKPSLMDWTSDGSGFFIDYSQDKKEMSDLIQQFFRRKTRDGTTQIFSLTP